MKRALLFAMRLGVLTVFYLILFTVAFGLAFNLLGVTQPEPAEGADSLAAATLLALAFLNSLALAIMIARSRWSSHALALVVGVVHFGVATFLTQIEAAVFPAVANRMGPNSLPALFLAGALLAVSLAPLAVLVMGKWRAEPLAGGPRHRLDLAWNEWVWRLTLIGCLYVGLYFTFGYYVAWRNPVVAAYYGGSDPGSLPAQLASVAQNEPWLFLFQFLRGVVWALLAVPVVRMLKGGTLEAGLVVGLQFAVLMNSALLLPNPYMPDPVRMAHLLETAPSNFLLGIASAGVLLWRQRTGSIFSHQAPILR